MHFSAIAYWTSLLHGPGIPKHKYKVISLFLLDIESSFILLDYSLFSYLLCWDTGASYGFEVGSLIGFRIHLFQRESGLSQYMWF